MRRSDGSWRAVSSESRAAIAVAPALHNLSRINLKPELYDLLQWYDAECSMYAVRCGAVTEAT